MFCSYLCSLQNELIAFNETTIKFGGKLILSQGQEALSFSYFEFEISHKLVY